MGPVMQRIEKQLSAYTVHKSSNSTARIEWSVKLTLNSSTHRQSTTFQYGVLEADSTLSDMLMRQRCCIRR